MIFISKSFRTIVFVFIGFFHNVSAAVSSGLPQVSPVYLGIEMIQPKKSFFKFDCWSNKVFYSQTIKMVFQFESFLCPDKQGTPADGRRIQWPKRCEKNNKDNDNSPNILTDKR